MKKDATLTEAMTKGIKIGLNLARSNPDATVEELFEYCLKEQKRIQSLSKKELEEIING